MIRKQYRVTFEGGGAAPWNEMNVAADVWDILYRLPWVKVEIRVHPADLDAAMENRPTPK